MPAEIANSFTPLPSTAEVPTLAMPMER